VNRCRGIAAEILSDLSYQKIIDCREAMEGTDKYFAEPFSIMIINIDLYGRLRYLFK